MLRRPPRSTRTATHFPDSTLFRSRPCDCTTSPTCSGKSATFLALPVGLVCPVLAWPRLAPKALNPAEGDLHPAHQARAADVGADVSRAALRRMRSEEHTSELQSLMRISYAVFCLKKKQNTNR